MERLKMTIGIYAIICKPTSKVYVGQSKNIKGRKGKHVTDLLKGKHCNSYLQNTFNKYGRENFTFTVLENCTQEQLTEREAFWITKYRSNESRYGFNLKEAGDAPCSEQHKLNCKEANIKKLVAQNGLWNLFNLETGEYTQIESKQEIVNENKNYNFRKHLLALRDGFTLQDFKEYYDRYNYYQDCQNSKGNKFYAKNLQTGEVTQYTSIAGGAKILDINDGLIRNVLQRKKLSTNGYTFSRTEEFPDTTKAFKVNVFPVFILDKEGVRYYDSQYTAAKLEFPEDLHAATYIKDFIDTTRSHKGKRFFSSQPTEVDIVQVQYDLTPLEAIAYKIIYENKTIDPKQLPSTSKSRNQHMKKKLINLNLITQCPTSFAISLVN